MKSKFLVRLLKKIKIFVWLLFILMFIQSCLFKNSEAVVVGIMFLMMSILFIPFEEKINNILKIKLNIKNKITMAFIIFIITCIYVYPKDESYYYPLLSFLTITLVWLLMINFKKNKQRKNIKR